MLWCNPDSFHLEAQDDGPDETQDETMVTVHDVMWPHVLQVNPLFFEELQSLVHVLQAVDTHPAFGRFRLWREERRIRFFYIYFFLGLEVLRGEEESNFTVALESLPAVLLTTPPAV